MKTFVVRRKELCREWRILSEKIKDRLSGVVCAEIGVYDFDAKIEKNKSEVSSQKKVQLWLFDIHDDDTWARRKFQRQTSTLHNFLLNITK